MIVLFVLGIFFISRTQAQNTVTGTITDTKTGEALSGASVKVDGSSIGVSTDGQGRYSISVPSSNAKLLFSFIGYQPEEVSVGGQKVINVQMVNSEASLNEVVVTALGISRQKKSLGYSVSEVNSDNLVKASNPNVLNH